MNKHTIYGFILLILTVVLYQNCSTGFEGYINTRVAASEEMYAVSTECEIPPTKPALLSETCLAKTNNGLKGFKNLRSYEPKYTLYSDGAYKRRWIYLPEDTQIDTQNPDEWVFPVGTILWKEFSLNGKKIETRQLEKMSPGEGQNSWRRSVYVWLNDQSDAELIEGNLTELNEVEFQKYAAYNERNNYTVPNINQCMTCHRGSRDVSLGFNNLQLAHVNPPVPSPASKIVHLTIDGLVAAGQLSHPPLTLDDIPGLEIDKQAIGYIQSNCAFCHNPRGLATAINYLHLSSNVRQFEENLIQTAKTRNLIVPGRPNDSELYRRMISDARPMPPRGTIPLRTMDIDGVDKVYNWILNLKQPIGELESITETGLVTGWSLNEDAKTSAVTVEVYSVDEVSGVSQLLATIATSVVRDDINTTYGATGAHGFTYQLPANQLSAVRKIQVYALDPSGKRPNQLASSPLYFVPPVERFNPPPEAPPNIVRGTGFFALTSHSFGSGNDNGYFAHMTSSLQASGGVNVYEQWYAMSKPMVANAIPLYSCQEMAGTSGFFLSASAECEGHVGTYEVEGVKTIRLAGYVYPRAYTPEYKPIYRCLIVATNNRYLSSDENCTIPGMSFPAGSRVNETRLGYGILESSGMASSSEN